MKKGQPCDGRKNTFIFQTKLISPNKRGKIIPIYIFLTIPDECYYVEPTAATSLILLL